MYEVVIIIRQNKVTTISQFVCAVESSAVLKHWEREKKKS